MVVCILTSEGMVSTKIVWNQLKVMREKSMLKHSMADVMTSHITWTHTHSQLVRCWVRDGALSFNMSFRTRWVGKNAQSHDSECVCDLTK